ncbi:hypothetical protein Dimus_001749, partial [Dionaea muscipula]
PHHHQSRLQHRTEQRLDPPVSPSTKKPVADELTSRREEDEECDSFSPLRVPQTKRPAAPSHRQRSDLTPAVGVHQCRTTASHRRRCPNFIDRHQRHPAAALLRSTA